MVAEGNIDIGAGAAVELQSHSVPLAGWAVAVLHALAGLDIVETLPPSHAQRVVLRFRCLKSVR
jgi:hypothetical protein